MTATTMIEKINFKNAVAQQYAAFNVRSIEMINSRQTVDGIAGVSVFIQAAPEQLDALTASQYHTNHEAASWDADNNIVEYDVFLYHRY